MPVLEIEFVGEGEPAPSAQKLADAVGEVLNTPAGQTWVKVRVLPEAYYAENGSSSHDLRPVFVSILLRKLPEEIERERIARSLGQAIAKVSGRASENIHILFLPEGHGRAAFGGNLIR
mgnify:CR=1 FL=1